MPELKRPLKVFLSYASQDKSLVRELSRRLVGEGWIDTWQDEKNLLPGQDWRVKIEEAVEEADVVIIVLSQHSVSKEGHVQKELRYAREIALEKPEDSIFLIPLRLDECEVPRGLRFYQWMDYFGERKNDGYDSLIKSLQLRYEQKLKQEEEGSVRQEKIRKEREAAEKIIRENTEKKVAEKAWLELEEKARQRNEKIMAEREAAKKAAREEEKRVLAEKAKHEKEENKSNVVKLKARSGIAYLIVGIVILVFGIGLFSSLNGGGGFPKSTQTSEMVFTSSPAPTLSTSLDFPRNLIPSASVTGTQVPQITPTSSNVFGGMLVYKSSGNNNSLSEFFIVDLTTDRQVQVTDNQGFNISNEKISDNNKYISFLYWYGDNDAGKLGVVNIDGTKIVPITNDLNIATADYFDWLPNSKLIFQNKKTRQVEIYDPLKEKIEVLGFGTSYFLSNDRGKVAVFDSQTKNLSVGDLDNISSGLKLIVNSAVPVVDLGKFFNVVWAPDGEKFAIITGDYYRKEKMQLSLWSKDGIRDLGLTVEDADHISFSWGENSGDYAYLVGTYENNKFTNKLNVDSKSIDIGQSQYLTGLYILPDRNLVYGYSGYASYLMDRKSLDAKVISGEYNLRSINNDITILYKPYSQDIPFILADKNGLHNLELSPFDMWSWNWIRAGDGLWLVSGNQILNLNTNESKTLTLPANSAIIAWTPANYYSNFSILPTMAPPLDLGIFTCNVWQIKVDKKYLARRTCSCYEVICNCIDYPWGDSPSEWERERNGVEDYFSELGGSCTNP